jgi:transcriptional regulator with XRE-family HTH domain
MGITPGQIRARRIALGWSQKRLADAGGISEQAERQHELGHLKLRPEKVERLADAVDLDRVGRFCAFPVCNDSCFGISDRIPIANRYSTDVQWKLICLHQTSLTSIL